MIRAAEPVASPYTDQIAKMNYPGPRYETRLRKTPDELVPLMGGEERGREEGEAFFSSSGLAGSRSLPPFSFTRSFIGHLSRAASAPRGFEGFSN